MNLPNDQLPSLIDPVLLGVMAKIARETPAGAFAEFGVYRGGSAKVLHDIAKEQDRRLFLYDTFTGMPFQDQIDQHRVGEFGDCSVEAIRKAMPGAVVIQGIFPESVVPMPPLAFVHVDCDQYRSVIAACDVFPQLIVKGGVMLFDDYRGVQGCIQAVNERYPDAVILDDGRAMVKF